MSEDVVFELAPLSVQFFVNLQARIAELDADGFSVQDSDLLHKLAGDGVIVYRKFCFPLFNKLLQAVHPGRLASLPFIRLPERSKLVQDALPLLCDLSESDMPSAAPCASASPGHSVLDIAGVSVPVSIFSFSNWTVTPSRISSRRAAKGLCPPRGMNCC